MEQFKKEIVFMPAWDNRSSDPGKNYGIHGVDMHFHLYGPKGMIQFITYTQWHLPEVQEELNKGSLYEKAIGGDPCWAARPQPADLGYHSPVPLYEGQQGRDDCPFLEGGKCYYDGSSLAAIQLFEVLVREGSEGVWKRMAEEYHEVFSTRSTS